MRIPTRSLAAFGAAAILLAACGGSVPSDAAATVNGEEIPRSQVEDAMDELSEQLEQVPDDQRDQAEEDQQRQILSLLIQNAVITEVTDEQGVEVDDETLDEVREDVTAQVGGEEQLPEALAQAGLTMTIFEEVFLPQQARITALSEQLAEGETLETRTVRHILVESEEEGEEAVQRLDDGEDFGDVAGEMSTDVGSAEQGGELPPSPRGAFVPEFDEATWESDLNEVVGPVESQFGFHVLEVLEEDVTEASDLDPQQLQQIVGPELEELIVGAFDEAEIEVDSSFGEWDPAQQAVVPEGQVGEAPEMPVDPGQDPGQQPEMSPEEMEELQRQLEEMEEMSPEELEGEAPEGEAPEGDAPEGDDASEGDDTEEPDES